MPKPDLALVPPFYHNYITQVEEEDLAEAFKNNQQAFVYFLQRIPEEKWAHKYAADKWTIKEVVQHVIDAERIFCYRALCFARGEKASLPGFNENEYATQSNANSRSKDDLINELGIVQTASQWLYKSFSREQLDASGIANGASIAVHAIGFIIIGHTMHHQRILNERYL